MKPLIGQPIPRVEDMRLLSGRGRYTDDLAPCAAA
jgi:CO/xanthine dehydrogenase Mo-binding subunit